MKIPLLALIIQGIPETIAVVTLASVLARIGLEWKKIVLFGAFLAFTAYVLRLFPITFGTHTIILTGLMFIFLIHYCQAPVLMALKACLISYLALIIVEYVCMTLLASLFGVTFEMVLENTTTRILITLPQVIIIFLLSFVLLKIRVGKEIKNESF